MSATAPQMHGGSSLKAADFKVNAFADTLMTDRLIKIYVGTREVPYLVSQVALCNASDYFAKAIKNEHMGKDNIGLLRFPEDSEDAWKVLLCWIIRGALPTIDQFPLFEAAKSTSNYGSVQKVILDLWIMGDMYLMPKLQNASMMLLLSHLDTWRLNFKAGVDCLRSHTTNSMLGRLICQSLVELTHGGTSDHKPEHLSALDGVPGAIVAIAAALEKFNKESRVMADGRRQWPDRIEGSEIWKEFMVME